MTKTKTVFYCQECGASCTKWQGQCHQCQQWNTLVAEITNKKAVKSQHYAGVAAEISLLKDVPMAQVQRHATGLSEFDHVLGGGLVSDSVILIGGDPGIGKSTLLLQILASLGKHHAALYVTGEESLQQIALRAQRLHVDCNAMSVLAETSVERIIELAQRNKPAILVIDSIQTIHTEEINSAPGGVSQVRESAAKLVRFAKQSGTALFIVGHVTKEGAIAGPRVLEHMVDTVLYFEGKSDTRFRIIRAVKNRFGAVNEIGVFAMTDKGLCQVSNPSKIFLSRTTQAAPGSVIMVAWEGSRPMLVEVQALVDESHLGNPRRVTVGVEANRLSMLLAILSRHCGIVTFNQDVFVNVVGGMRVLETGADLAVLLAILSSLKNRVLPQELVAFGEVGLSGEIRPVPSGVERIREVAKHGFTRMIVPRANAPKKPIEGVEITAVDTLEEAIKIV